MDRFGSRWKLTAIVILTLMFNASSAQIDEYQLEQLIGWTIVAAKTIEGYKDPGEEKSDDWEGCDFDRKVYFMDGTTVTCNSFGYQYAFMPKAIIFGTVVKRQGKEYTLLKMLVDGELYDIM